MTLCEHCSFRKKEVTYHQVFNFVFCCPTTSLDLVSLFQKLDET